jgi:mono/diheme cytochrome c family protein
MTPHHDTPPMNPSCLPRLLVCLCGLFALPAASAAAPADLEPEDLRPGLAAVYRSLADRDPVLHRIDVKPAFHLGDSSPHPRIPPGPFEVVWTGVLAVKETGPISFDASLCGHLTLEVDGTTLLKGEGTSEKTSIRGKDTLNVKPGFYRFRVQYRSLAGKPARLQIGWQGTAFAREPLPAWRLSHVPAELPDAARQETLAAEGRDIVRRLGCARCHAKAFPGISDPPPGPSLADAAFRLRRVWLLQWLEHPSAVRPGAAMPALFAANRAGFVERWVLAEHLLRPTDAKPPAKTPPGDHRDGRLAYVGLGCAACHFVPDLERSKEADLGRSALTGLGDRLPPDSLAAFLMQPHTRYPDGRMPRLPIEAKTARDIAAYLLFWSKPSTDAAADPPTTAEIDDLARRLGVRSKADAAAPLLQQKGCQRCHAGLGDTAVADIPIRGHAAAGCLSGKSGPRFDLDRKTAASIAAYLSIADREKHPSPFQVRQEALLRAGCIRCHQRDSERQPPIEETGSTLGGAYHQYLPFQRTPRLTYAHEKYTRAHLLQAVRDGVSGLRPSRYTYRMPPYGPEAAALVRALAEADGALPEDSDPAERVAADPTLGPLNGPALVGFQGYACVSCHVWNGRQLSESDPGAVGPDLTRTIGRIRRDWFDRYLENPLRAHPGTPMPAIFPRGSPAPLRTVLDGDPTQQREALWSYFALGKDAPSPKALPPLPIEPPAPGQPPLVAQVPLHLPVGGIVESIALLDPSDDLLLYDLGSNAIHSFWTAGRILRTVEGRSRKFHIAGTAFGAAPLESSWEVHRAGELQKIERILGGYDRLPDGVRIRWRVRMPRAMIDIEEKLTLSSKPPRLLRELHVAGLPTGVEVRLATHWPKDAAIETEAATGEAKLEKADRQTTLLLRPDGDGKITATLRYHLPPPHAAAPWEGKVLVDSGLDGGSLERPGYRAIAYPRPKTVSGEDRVMPAAVAVHPRDGRVFISSLKTGELFLLDDPAGDGRHARFVNFGGGLHLDALSMLAEDDALYVLHRRNLTRIALPTTGQPTRFDRVAALQHGVADTYDYAYGLVRDRSGGFVISYAQYADARLIGAGSAIRLTPGKPPEEIAFGFRNPLGWCAGPDGEVFFTDNQGDWVATNKLCHLTPGRFFGFPNRSQKQHTSLPMGKTAVWVPYGWARSINGATFDTTGGKFGPFAGQFFLAELMFGGAIIRANVEKVNGEYQGACFPFWGKGLLGPLTLAFDPRKGSLYVGGITEPGWMAQPDRGALYRIDFTGQTPFEIQSIHARPDGFRLVFTRPFDPAAANRLSSYQVEHYRYEYTGAYGSPELDRTTVPIEQVTMVDGRTIDLRLKTLIKDRVYLITASGVVSPKGEQLVHPAGAYTLNEIPGKTP